MKIGYSYKTDRAEEAKYNISCDREAVELLANWQLLRLRAALTKEDAEPSPLEIDEEYKQWRALMELLEE